MPQLTWYEHEMRKEKQTRAIWSVIGLIWVVVIGIQVVMICLN